MRSVLGAGWLADYSRGLDGDACGGLASWLLVQGSGQRCIWVISCLHSWHLLLQPVPSPDWDYNLQRGAIEPTDRIRRAFQGVRTYLLSSTAILWLSWLPISFWLRYTKWTPPLNIEYYSTHEILSSVFRSKKTRDFEIVIAVAKTDDWMSCGSLLTYWRQSMLFFYNSFVF